MDTTDCLRDRRDAFREDVWGISEMGKKIQVNFCTERIMNSLIRARSWIPPMVRGRSSGKASLLSCTASRRGSLTMESACVLPLFLFGLITMIFFMDFYRVETVRLTALCQQAKEEGLAVYTPGARTEEVTVTDESAFRPMQLLLPLPPVMVVNKVTVHAWTGTDRFGPGTGGGRPEPMVYITETGHVIHHDPGCTYLRLTVHAVDGNTLTDRRNSSGERYHACERCSYHQAPGAVVYITDQGNRYHNLGSCSALRRTVRLVKESEAEGYHDCSRCGNK